MPEILKLHLIFFISSFVYHAYSQELHPKAFEACVACHSFKSGEHVNGPSLDNLFEQIAGKKEGFRYSGPMKRSGLIWTESNLRDFILNPQEKIPGNRMPFSGLENPEDLNTLIQYIRKMSTKD